VVLPTIPLEGLNENDAPNVNIDETMFVPSDASMVWTPCGTAGIVTGHAKVPVESEEQDADGAFTPSSVNEIGPSAANPVPVAVVEVPARPLVGFSDTEASTEKAAEAVFVPSDALIACVP